MIQRFFYAIEDWAAREARGSGAAWIWFCALVLPVLIVVSWVAGVLFWFLAATRGDALNNALEGLGSIFWSLVLYSLWVPAVREIRLRHLARGVAEAERVSDPGV